MWQLKRAQRSIKLLQKLLHVALDKGERSGNPYASVLRSSHSDRRHTIREGDISSARDGFTSDAVAPDAVWLAPVDAFAEVTVSWAHTNTVLCWV